MSSLATVLFTLPATRFVFDAHWKYFVFQLKKWTQSVEDCNRCLSLDDTYIKAYLRRAKSYMELQKFEEAVRDYENLLKSNKGNKEYRQLLHEAKLELRKSKRKDLYKILGVKNSKEDSRN